MTTLELKKPVEFGGEVITKLELRNPVGKDIMSMPMKQEMEFGTFLKLGARLANRESAVVELMDVADCIALVTIVGNLFGDSQETGEPA